MGDRKAGLAGAVLRSLVVGASGLVGSHVALALAALGPVTTTALRYPSMGARVLDVRDAAAVEAIARETRPDVIVCAAAEPSVERCEAEPAATRAINVGGTENVARAARSAGAVLVCFSSDYVFDGTAAPYAEGDPVAPLNEYGRQKVAIERIALGVPRALVCRLSGVFGIEARRKNFVCQVVDRLRRGGEVVAADDQTLCPTPARDAASAVARLVESGARGVVHVVGPEPLTRAAFARRVARAFDLPEERVRGVPTSSLSLRARRPRDSALRDDLLRSLLGSPLGPLDDALAAARAAGL